MNQKSFRYTFTWSLSGPIDLPDGVVLDRSAFDILSDSLPPECDQKNEHVRSVEWDASDSEIKCVVETDAPLPEAHWGEYGWK